jgi:hypothetical protein
LCGGRSTNYYTYSGSGIYEGKGEASKNIKRIDIWLVGTPPRKFRIIGHITNSQLKKFYYDLTGNECGKSESGGEDSQQHSAELSSMVNPRTTFPRFL